MRWYIKWHRKPSVFVRNDLQKKLVVIYWNQRVVSAFNTEENKGDSYGRKKER